MACAVEGCGIVALSTRGASRDMKSTDNKERAGVNTSYHHVLMFTVPARNIRASLMVPMSAYHNEPTPNTNI